MSIDYETQINETGKRNYRRLALMMTAAAMAVVYVLWNVPALATILYPLRLFTTYIHEAGHSLAALLTGGRVIGFVVSADGSGVATTAGGARWIILPAGYLGAALFGSLLFYTVNRFPRMADGIAVAVGFGLILFTVLFARADETGMPVATVVGMGFGALMMFIGAKTSKLVTLLVLNVLAVSTALEAVMDLRYLVSFADVASRGTISNDAAAFARDVMPLVSPSMVALTWAGMSIVIFAVAVYAGAWQPLRQEINEGYQSIVNR